MGGIPELLEPSVLVEKENPEALADLIQRLVTDYDFTNEQAKRNLNEALLYKEDRLKELRNQYFEYIKAQRDE